MSTIWQRSRDVAEALSRLGVTGVEGLIRAFVQQTESAAARAEEALDELLVRTEANRAQVTTQVRDETRAAVESLGLASRDDVARLARRLEALEGRLRELTAEVDE